MQISLKSTEVDAVAAIICDAADVTLKDERAHLTLHFHRQVDTSKAIATLQNFPLPAGTVMGSVALQQVSINLNRCTDLIVTLS